MRSRTANKTSRTAWRTALLAAACVASLGGCAAPRSAPPAPTPISPAELRYEQQVQQDIAGCMNRAGFDYRSDLTDPDSYRVLSAERRRYGFYLFAPYAMPDDRQVHEHTVFPGATDLTDSANPNAATVQALTPTRLVDYDNSLYGAPSANGERAGGCRTAGYEAAASAAPNPSAQHIQQVQTSYFPAISAALDSYSACLTRKGYTMPGVGQQTIEAVYHSQQQALNAALRAGHGSLTPDAARSGMSAEITAALDDLTCGQTWYQLHDAETLAMYQ